MSSWLERLKGIANSDPDDADHTEDVVRNVAAAALLAGTETVGYFIVL